jgi:hypothetical protein
MALGANIQAAFGVTPPKAATQTITAQLRSSWATIIDNGGLETQDDATVTSPDAEITNSTTHILATGGRGSTLLLRMKYDDGLATITDPVIRVFGRHSSGDTGWMALHNSNSTPAITTTITTAATDNEDGTNKWTEVTADETFPLQGCDEVLVGVQTALAAGGGDPTLSTLEAKVV